MFGIYNRFRIKRIEKGFVKIGDRLDEMLLGLYENIENPLLSLLCRQIKEIELLGLKANKLDREYQNRADSDVENPNYAKIGVRVEIISELIDRGFKDFERSWDY